MVELLVLGMDLDAVVVWELVSSSLLVLVLLLLLPAVLVTYDGDGCRSSSFGC